MIRRALESLRDHLRRRRVERIIATARDPGLPAQLRGIDVPLQIRGWRVAARSPSRSLSIPAEVHPSREDALRHADRGTVVPDFEWQTLLAPDLLRAHLDANRPAITEEIRDTILDPAGPFVARGHAVGPAGHALRIEFGTFPNVVTAASAIRAIRCIRFVERRCRVLLQDGTLLPARLSMVDARAVGHPEARPASTRTDRGYATWAVDIQRPESFRFELIDAEGSPLPLPQPGLA